MDEKEDESVPTATTEVSNSRPAIKEAGSDRLEEAHRSLQASLSSGEEAVSAAVGAWSEFLRAFLPGVVTEPARTLDLVFEFVQQSLSLQRRLVRELIGTVQAAMAEMAIDEPWGASRADGSEGSRRPTSARTAA